MEYVYAMQLTEIKNLLGTIVVVLLLLFAAVVVDILLRVNRKIDEHWELDE